MGHAPPLGPKTQAIKRSESELKIPAAQPNASTPVDKPSVDAKPDAPKPLMVVKREKPAADAAAPLPQMDLSGDDIERLPPDRRAAVLRYLKAVQASRAATQPTEK